MKPSIGMVSPSARLRSRIFFRPSVSIPAILGFFLVLGMYAHLDDEPSQPETPPAYGVDSKLLAEAIATIEP